LKESEREKVGREFQQTGDIKGFQLRRRAMTENVKLDTKHSSGEKKKGGLEKKARLAAQIAQGGADSGRGKGQPTRELQEPRKGRGKMNAR